MAARFSIVVVVFLLAFSFLAFHLYQVQLVKGGYYLAKATSQQAAADSVNGNRGAIYFVDNNGKSLPAAVNQDFPTIYAVPTAIKDPASTAKTFAPILGMTVSALQKILSRPNDSYEPLVKKADANVAAKVESLNVAGMVADYEPDRFYPLSTVASHVLGFVGPNASGTGESGHYGLEKLYDASLLAGNDLTLTIDPNIQIEAEKILDDLIAANNATGGSVIVEDPQTGKILAMGSWPNFDANNYGASPIGNLLNPVMQKVYEPGSVFKVLTMAAGIDAGKLTPQTTYTDYGTVKVSGHTISNYDYKTHGAYGLATMTNVIEHSINTGAVFAEGRVGNTTFANYLARFGLGEKTGVDLPGEVGGNLRALTSKAPQIAFSTASYGQGVAITPLELLNAVAAIANGGTLMRPYLNAALSPQIIRRVVTTSTAEQVTGMMISAVDKAQVANIEGYSLAGKTGTAFIPDLKHGGYLDRVIDSYVGFGPTSNPKFIALVKIDNLPSDALAALSVVPAFRELSQYIINYYGIPPDRIGQ